jgi:hypothetical protein
MTFIYPDFLTILSEIAPPSQAYQQPASNILDDPEVNTGQHSDDDKHKDLREDKAEKKVPNNCECLEDKGANARDGVSGHVEIVAVVCGLA